MIVRILFICIAVKWNFPFPKYACLAKSRCVQSAFSDQFIRDRISFVELRNDSSIPSGLHINF